MASVTLTGMAIYKRIKEAASIQSAGGAQKMCVMRYILNANCTGEGEKFIMFEQGVGPPP